MTEEEKKEFEEFIQWKAEKAKKAAWIRILISFHVDEPLAWRNE